MELTPIIREDDNELLGFVQEQAGQWQALTMFRYPLQSFATRREAENLLRSLGMRILMEKWYFLDTTLNDWYACQIVEASTERIRFKITDLGHPDLFEVRVLAAPQPEVFRPER